MTKGNTEIPRSTKLFRVGDLPTLPTRTLCRSPMPQTFPLNSLMVRDVVMEAVKTETRTIETIINACKDQFVVSYIEVHDTPHDEHTATLSLSIR